MIDNLITSIFGDPDKKKIKKYEIDVKQIREIEKEISNLTLVEIQEEIKKLKDVFEGLDFEENNEAIFLNKAFDKTKHYAVAYWLRTCDLLSGKSHTLDNGKTIEWNMKPYDVQIIGGLAIHDSNIAEMKTGEGKTLVATLPAFINSLTGNSIHIVTVNDYLAERDAMEMSILYKALGLSVGVIKHNQSNEEKKENYSKDIVYATNNELGFDYLRDNMVNTIDEKVMSKKFFAIIDEVDSILIDEARTPLIISMPDNEPTQKYLTFSKFAKSLKKDIHYKLDEKAKTALLSEEGIKKTEEFLGVDNIYTSERYNDLHHVENALKARFVYVKDKDYIIEEDNVMIVDEHTGRALSGRRYSDGLHQALEAKENVKIQQESKTLASITFQNYFRMYWKLAGMTGTAKTEEEEFYKVYGLETLVIPTNRIIAREDKADLLFKNEQGKFSYVVDYIEELHKTEQPILVGTVSVDKSEYLSEELIKRGIVHKVLNAKQSKTEAETVSNAGQRGAITIATNMAGRGTDIKLGEGVKELGGLIILGTEKHETRRIDNQLRGRAGRQGDPGITQFLISPNDDIMRIFGGNKIFSIFNSPMFASLPDNKPLVQSGMLAKKVTGVQKQVEGHHFDSRKQVLEYDDVVNKHREIVYRKRNAILDASSDREVLELMLDNIIDKKIKEIVLIELSKDTKVKDIVLVVNEFLGKDIVSEEQTFTIDLEKHIAYEVTYSLKEIEKDINNTDLYRNIVKSVMLQSIDLHWMNHIDSMGKLKEQVAFVSYAQKQPLMVYKEKAFQKFEELLFNIDNKIIKSMFSLTIKSKVEETKNPLFVK